MTTKREIREVSTQLYAALKRMLNGDARAMSDVWSHRSFVTAMHPLGGRQVGWAEVRKTWEVRCQDSRDEQAMSRLSEATSWSATSVIRWLRLENRR